MFLEKNNGGVSIGLMQIKGRNFGAKAAQTDKHIEKQTDWKDWQCRIKNKHTHTERQADRETEKNVIFSVA